MNWVVSTILYTMIISVVLNAVIFGIFKATHRNNDDDE